MKHTDLQALRKLVNRLSRLKENQPCKSFVTGCFQCTNARVWEEFKSLIYDALVSDEEMDKMFKASATKIAKKKK